MIKKLKFKFITINMVLITMVLLICFGIIYINTAKDLEQNSMDTLYEIAESNKGGLNSPPKPNMPGGSKNSYLTTFIIELDTINNTCYIDGFSDLKNLTDEEIEYINDIIRTVGYNGKSEGILDSYNLRYVCMQTAKGMRIVLLDKQYEDDNLARLMISFLVTGGIAFAAFLIISFILATWVIKPVAKSMNQQRQLIADVSHELKTPLAVITSNADVILSHSDSTVENEEKWLGYIKDESRRMSELINTMLYLAKSDEEIKHGTFEDVDLSSLAYEITLPFESICFECGKTIITDIAPDIIVKGNESSLKQLLVILLDNAIKYSNENGRIELKLKKNGDKALISVFNTGTPIPKDSIPYIFDRFYRVDKSRSREKGGSGLGLSIAKRIIENNEANISVLSDNEHGTVFTCAFDLSKTKRKINNA